MNSAQQLPQQFSDQMRRLIGVHYDNFTKALDQPSPVSIRINPHKLSTHNSATPIPWCSTGTYLAERPSFTLDPTFHSGAYYVQEASSMFLEQALKQTTDLNQPLHVLDLCAAPGGKSTHILSLINNESLLISNEVIRSRSTILSENIQKWGHANVVVTNNDPTDFQRLKGFFDVVVVDAPCSGEGLFRKDPEAMKEWSPDNVNLCWMRQRRIVSDIWSTIKPGGILIYSTCTYNRLENEENLQWINNEYDAEFIELKTEPSWGVEEVKEGDIVGYHFYPHKVRGEGFFIAAIRKTSAQDSIHIKQKNKIFQRPTVKVAEQLNYWVKDVQNKTFLMFKENILMVHASKVQEIEFLTQQLHIITAGTTVAEVKHDKLIPDQAFALSLEIQNNFFNEIELTREQALQYLRKETIQSIESKKGFALFKFENLALGWANILDNRINNMYPANWRIRMTG